MGNNINKADRTMEWILAAVIGIAVIFGIFQFREDYNLRGGHRNEVYCSMAEHDAQNIAAAIADYFAWPEHTTLPNISGESEVLGFTLNSRDGQNIAWVTGDAESTITIVVKDGSGKCPEDYQDINRGWDSGRYTIKLE